MVLLGISISGTGSLIIEISVVGEIFTIPLGLVLTTRKGTEWPSIMMRSVSPLVAGLSIRRSLTNLTKSLSTLMRISTGASLREMAYSASAFLTETNSFMDAPEFFRMKPSILRSPCPWSSG
ncbi:hypothetical protein ES703_78627 [subsurface metagenome]